MSLVGWTKLEDRKQMLQLAKKRFASLWARALCKGKAMVSLSAKNMETNGEEPDEMSWHMPGTA